MEIYKYRIWTGNIPGDYTSGCTTPDLITPIRNTPQPPSSSSLDCSPCENLGDSLAIMNACLDCWNGAVNVCCPSRNESCCGIIKDDCEKFYEMTAQQQQEYCSNCNSSTAAYQQIDNMIGPVFTINRYTSEGFKMGKQGISCKCCNRTDRDSNDSNLVIFLEQDLNDIGHYEIWDGFIDQADTFSNFVAVGDPNNPYTVSVTNTTDFKFFKFLENIQYTIDWGEPGSTPQTLTAPLDTATNIYASDGVYQITIQMSAPWGVSSVSHHIAVPYQTGAALWSTVVNTGQTYTFTPPGFTTPVSMDYETSDWGPLDSGLDINGYITALYTTTPYPIMGYTDSMLSSLQSYNTSTNSPYLPAGYTIGNVVNIGGQAKLPDGTYVNNLQGVIDNATSTYTAYTITNCITTPCQTFQMFDYINGETTFETNSYGLFPEDFLTRECGYAIQGACDMCNKIQVYPDGTGQWLTQDVFNDRGVWDITETYEPTDFVYHDGCCFYAISTIPVGEEPDALDTFSSFWRLCYDSCTPTDLLPSKYDCIDGICIKISPTSTYYPTAQFQGATTADALNACVTHPCIPTTSLPIHYDCVNGACSPVSPSSPGWGGAQYQPGTSAQNLAACQADIGIGCIDLDVKYNCIYDAGSYNCVAAGPVGTYPTLTDCQQSCGGTTTAYDWYCVSGATTPSGTDCAWVLQDPGGFGIAPPHPDAVMPLQGPYQTKAICQSHGCGMTEYNWYCKCTLTQGPNVGSEAIVDLGGGSYGGNSCVTIANGPPGGFSGPNAQQDCEDNCLSWECDGHGNCGQTNLNNPPGSFCSDTFIANGGYEYWGAGGNIDIPGCQDDCPIPSTWVCMGGNCTELLEPPHQTGCINPSHVSNSTPWNGSCIDWNYANNMPVTGCDEVPKSFCEASLGTGAGCQGGCGECDRLSQLGFNEWPFKVYETGVNYYPYDVVIGWLYPQSNAPNDSDFKYWYNPRPICDPNKGIVWVGPVSFDCSLPAMITACESAPYGNGSYHPCTDSTAPACDSPPITNAPPTIPGQSRYVSRTCWDHC